VRGYRPIAEGVLGAESRMDFVGVDPEGRAAVALVGGPGADLELLARGLAQRAWLRSRLPDWLQLAPDLGARPEADVAIVLLCPAFRTEAVSAAREAGGVVLARYRFVWDAGASRALLELLDEPEWGESPRTAVGPTSSLEPSPFRTGLTEADFALGGDEKADLE
jgi:hypothetical protein